MIIINGIARGVSPCVRAPPVWPLRSECCGRGVPTKVVCAECMKMCCLGGKNSEVKGLMTQVWDEWILFVEEPSVYTTSLVDLQPTMHGEL